MHSEISTPADAPAWASDRSQLWNKVESTEKRKDAQLARDVDAALPRELDLEQQKVFVREFIEVNFTSRGMVADWNIHESDATDGGKNPHVHIMLTMRPLDGEGFGNKAREWNNPELLTEWRSSWEALQNQHLEMAGSDERISMESYQAQGIDREAQSHLGNDAHQLETGGFETAVGDFNRGVDHRNDVRDVLFERIDFEPDDFFFDFLDNDQAAEVEPAAALFDRGELGRPLSPAEEHQATLADYFRLTVERTVEATAELVNRLGDWFERTAELGRESLERFVRDEGRDFGLEREREMERGR